MNGSDLPQSWKEYIDAIDNRLVEKGVPLPIRKGIAQDVEEHLHQMASANPDISRDDFPDFLDSPEAYADAFEEASSSATEAKSGERPIRLRECHSRHGEDGKRRIHICGRCFRAFQGCLEYETHECDADFHWSGKRVPHWSHQKRWITAIVLAALLFAPIFWFTHSRLVKEPCSGGRRRYHEYPNIRYLRELTSSIIMFRVNTKREPETLQELVDSGIWKGNWVMPGDLEDLGGEGGFAAERLYYIHAAGTDMSELDARQPWLVLSSLPRNTGAICYTVAYTDGDTVHYPTLGEFLTDWEAKQ